MTKPLINILLVEDSASDANLLRRIFTRAGNKNWQITHVERLSEAIHRCELQAESETPFDMVLLDLHLPDSRGLETVSQFRAVLPRLPVVVLTGMDDEELAMQAMAEGAQDYLVKNQITTQHLTRAIRYAIERDQVMRDLQEQEQRSRQALEEEQRLNQLQADFISMVAHEARTPLTMIRVAVELLRRNEQLLEEEKKQAYFDRIQASINQISCLLNDVLILGKADSNRLRCEPAPINLEEFCQNLADTLQVGTESHCPIIFAVQGDCSEAEMDGDLLRCVFTNLLINAIKYSPQGGDIYFTLTRQDSSVIFQVADQGVGIPAADQQHLFENFYRGRNVRTIQGTGLGLTIVKKCVDLQDGTISIHSQENRGTTVTVTLPLKSCCDRDVSNPQ